MEIITKTEITSKQLADAFVGAVECNDMVTSWCGGFYNNNDIQDQFKINNIIPWYSNPAFWEMDYKVTVIHDNANSNEGERDCTTVMTPTMVKEGLHLMADKFPYHFNNLMTENADSITYDIMLQCIILKNVIFG